MKWHTDRTFCRLIYMPVRYLATKKINSNDFPRNQLTQTIQVCNIRMDVHNVNRNGDPICRVITYASPLLDFFFTHKSHFPASYSAGTKVFSVSPRFALLGRAYVKNCSRLVRKGSSPDCDVTLPYMAARHLSWKA